MSFAYWLAKRANIPFLYWKIENKSATLILNFEYFLHYVLNYNVFIAV